MTTVEILCEYFLTLPAVEKLRIDVDLFHQFFIIFTNFTMQKVGLFTEDAVEILGKFLLTNENIQIIELFAKEAKRASIDLIHNALTIYEYLSKRASLKELVIDWNNDCLHIIGELNELLATNTFIENLKIENNVRIF